MSAGANINVDLFRFRRSFEGSYRPGVGNQNRPLLEGEPFVNLADNVICYGTGDGAFVEFSLSGRGTSVDAAPPSSPVALSDAAFQLAQVVAAGKPIYWPRGTFRLRDVVIPSNTTHIGAPRYGTRWVRADNSGVDRFIRLEDGATGVTLIDLDIDGNAANQTMPANNIQAVGGPYNNTFLRVRSRGAKAVGGYGSGLLVFDGADIINETRTLVEDCDFTGNDRGGLEVQGGGNWTVKNSRANKNGQTGIKFAKEVFPPVLGISDGLEIVGNTANQNGEDGIHVRGYYTGGTGARPIFAPGIPLSRFSEITGNRTDANARYGILAQVANSAVHDNRARRNGNANTGAGGGICANAEQTSFYANSLENNDNYGIDAGGAFNCAIYGNTIKDTGATANKSGFAINIGGGQYTSVVGNVLINNLGVGIYAIGIERAGIVAIFETLGFGGQINDNVITLPNATSTGIIVNEGFDVTTCRNNTVHGGSPGAAFYFRGGFSGASRFKLYQSGNVHTLTDGENTVQSGNVLVIRDEALKINITGTGDIRSIRTSSEDFYTGRVRFVTVANAGNPGDYDPSIAAPSVPGGVGGYTVEFTGGSPTRAATGWALISNAGKFVGVELTDTGEGYQSAPTMTIKRNGVAVGSGAGSVQIGLNATDGQTIQLMFFAACSVLAGGNVNVTGGRFDAVQNSILTLAGRFGGWFEVSRRA